jgi:DNA-binding transcriptional LysR family regulator
MLDDVEGLRALVAVADLGTFSAAGRALKRSTNAVSHRVARLEHRLGARLFERTTRVVRPTETGARLVERARRVLEELELLEQEASAGHLEGTVRVALPPDLASPELFSSLAQAMAASPGLSVELWGRGAPADPRRDGLDLVVWGGPTPVPPELTARRLGEVRFWLCAAASYVGRFGNPRDPEALSMHRCLLARAPNLERTWALVGPSGETRTVPVAGSLESDNPALLLGALQAGLGVGLRPAAEVAAAAAKGDWVHILSGWSLAPLPVALVAPRGRLRAPTVRLVAGLLEATVRRLAEPRSLSQTV